MIKITRPNIADAPSWYSGFFNLATGDDLLQALQSSRQQTLDLIGTIPFDMEDYRYAADKWTIKQVFIHLADEERYYAYKAFCYSRQVDVNLEASAISGPYLNHFNAGSQTLQQIARDYAAVRDATITLFSSMTTAMLDFKDFPTQPVYTARSLGWFTVGHNLHHCNLVKEKYLAG